MPWTTPASGSETVTCVAYAGVYNSGPTTVTAQLAVAPAGVSIHTPEFADHARSASGDRAVLDGARSMALTVVDTWLAGQDLAE